MIISANIVIGILYTPYMLRMMGQAEYGLYSLVASVISYLTILDLGFGNAIIRYTAKFRKENKTEEQYEMFGMFFRLYLVIGFIALVIGLGLLLNVDGLFGLTMDSDELKTIRILMILMSINLAFTFPLSIFGSIISAYENFVFQKLVNIVRIIVNPLIMIVFLYYGYKAITMVVVATVFNLATLLINWWYCYNKLHIKIVYKRFKWSLLKEVSIYSFWVFLAAIMDRIYWSSGQFLLGMYKGAADVAIYALAVQLKDMYYMFSTAISGVLLPKIVGMISTDSSDKEMSDLFIRIGRLQFIVMSYILFGFIILGDSFILLWAGPKYEDTYIIALLFYISSLFPLIQYTATLILMAKNKLKYRSILILCASVVGLIVSIPILKQYGAIASAAVMSLSMLIGHGLILNIYYSKKMNLEIMRFWKEIFNMSIPLFLIMIVGYFLKNMIVIDTIFLLLLSGVIYTLLFVLAMRFWSFNNYENEMFKKTMRRVVCRK